MVVKKDEDVQWHVEMLYHVGEGGTWDVVEVSEDKDEALEILAEARLESPDEKFHLVKVVRTTYDY